MTEHVNSAMNAPADPTDEKRVFTLVYADVPPSLNRAHSRHWSYFHKQKRFWESVFAGALMGASVPRGLAHVHAEASLRFPVVRRRDEGNFRWMLEKALGDALVKGRWLSDDTPEGFTTGALVFEAELGPKRTTVSLTT